MMYRKNKTKLNESNQTKKTLGKKMLRKVKRYCSMSATPKDINLQFEYEANLVLEKKLCVLDVCENKYQQIT